LAGAAVSKRPQVRLDGLIASADLLVIKLVL
jgi:hypothetical protein